MPSSAAISAACSSTPTIAPWPSTVTSVPRRTTRLACSGTPAARKSTGPFGQYRLFGSKNITGSSDRIASWIIQ
ncbi:hypothetical protein AX769_02920 [Frondihabitans sp. PAMC 28766]|nr:hypothetical protein AX769_02920 [Frondihabitans sp. PAMC 28766]